MASGINRGFRAYAAALAALSLAAIVYAYVVLEQGLGLEPCPLCIFDRVVLGAAAAVFLLAALHNPGGRIGRWLYAGVGTLVLAGGVAIGSRHVWLQQLPADEVPSCGPDLGYMFDAFPFLEAVDMVLSGSGSCAEIDTAFLGLSLAKWTLGLFLVLTAAAAYLVVRGPRMR